MGMEASCDVEGCDSRAPFNGDEMGGPFRVPHNWCVVLMPPTELEILRRRKELAQEMPEMMSLPIRGGGPDFPEKFIICDKHELPKFKRKK